MQIVCKKKENHLIIGLKGELDMSTADEFKNKIEEQLDVTGATNLIINFAEVPFVDSSGLGVILGRYKRVSEHGGKMGVVEVKPQVKRIFELSGIFRIINLFDDEATALAHL